MNEAGPWALFVALLLVLVILAGRAAPPFVDGDATFAGVGRYVG